MNKENKLFPYITKQSLGKVCHYMDQNAEVFQNFTIHSNSKVPTIKRNRIYQNEIKYMSI